MLYGCVRFDFADLGCVQLAALHAGVKTIEHGSYLTKEAIDLMIEKEVMLVATRSVVVNGVENPATMPSDSYKKLLEVADSNRKSYEAAVSSVPVV